MNSGKETITLKWSMDDESLSHWARGRGQQTARAVVLEGLHAIQENQDALESIRSCITKEVIPEEKESSDQDTQRDQSHSIAIQLPAADWGEAFQRVGNPGDNPVHQRHLLKAVILKSKSWKQCGNKYGSFGAGWNLNSLISSIDLSTELTHTEINLGQQEKVIAKIVAAATVVIAAATVANAVAAFWAL